MPRWPRSDDLKLEPRTRMGLCCGARCLKSKKRTSFDQPLFLVSTSRYRCRACFKREAGYWP